MKIFSFFICSLLIFSSLNKVWSADLLKGAAAYEKKDYKTAYKEWLALARQGDPKAQFFIGNMYYKGVFVSQNDGKAVKWYKRSAEQGLIKAQNNLGTMYMRGRGIGKNNIKAFVWLHITAMQGDKIGIKNRDLVAKIMTLNQIKKATQLAKECVKNKYKGC